MPSDEDGRLAIESIDADVVGDEEIRFDVTAFATLVWEEDPAPDRPEITGQWRLYFRDGDDAKEIDQQKTNTDAAIAEAKTLIAAKLVAE